MSRQLKSYYKHREEILAKKNKGINKKTGITTDDMKEYHRLYMKLYRLRKKIGK